MKTSKWLSRCVAACKPTRSSSCNRMACLPWVGFDGRTCWISTGITGIPVARSVPVYRHRYRHRWYRDRYRDRDRYRNRYRWESYCRGLLLPLHTWRGGGRYLQATWL